MDGPKNDLDSTFFLAFMGTKVCISLNVCHTIDYESPDGVTVETIPLHYEGILLDHDNEYYYLGNTPIEISQAVKKDSVVHIMIVEEKSVYDQILDHMPHPEKKEDVN